MTIITQKKAILKALEAGEAVTPLDALRRWGCFRLGARIFDLRQQGYEIETEMDRGIGQKYATYRLKKKAPTGDKSGLSGGA